MGTAKQQVYFTKDSGPGLWQALRELKDNPIAHYGLLQARRRAARVPQWQRWLAIVAVLAVCASLSPVFLEIWKRFCIQNYWGAPFQFEPAADVVMMSALTLTMAYGCWLALGLFHSTRNAALVLASPRSCSLSTVDELVAISPLGDTEVLAGTIKLIIAPLLPRLAVGATLPFVWTTVMLALGSLVQLNSQWYSYTGQPGQYTPLLGADAYSLTSLLTAFGSNVLSWLAMVFHGLIALTILHLLLIAAGRKASQPLLASVAAVIHSLTQSAWFALLGSGILFVLIAEGLYYTSNIEVDALSFLIGIGTGPIVMIILLRMMRGSMLLRSGALVVPALLPLVGFLIVTHSIILDSTWLGWLSFPMAIVLPGFAWLADATGVIDQTAAPMITMLSGFPPGGRMVYIFNLAWLAKISCQALFMPLLLVLARDAVRLYRQPGRL